MQDEILLENSDKYNLSFSEFRGIVEGFHNYLPKDVAKKQQDADEVHAILKKSYEDIGGLKGDEFKSPESMIQIPMWKIHKKDGKITSVAMYKDSGGRKRVAIGTNGEPSGKKSLGDIVSNDLKRNRAFVETSKGSLAFLKKNVDLTGKVKSFEEAKAYHAARGTEISRPKDEDPEVVRHPEFKDNFYVREIGGIPQTKLMLGHLGGVPITNH